MGQQDGIDTILNWPTLSSEDDLLSDEMEAYLQENPIAYAGHRIIANFIQVDGRHGTTEYNEVPFLGRFFFVFAIFGYWAYRRIRFLIDVDRTPEGFNGHLFIMHSSRQDKRHTLESVGDGLRNLGQEVLFLCSPEAEEYRKGWESNGFVTISFRELMGTIPLSRWGVCLERTIDAILGLRQRAPDAFSSTPLIILFNFLLLEAIKAEGVDQVLQKPVIHTYAPMGYLLASTDFDRVYAYQHGIMYGPDPETGHQAYRRGYPFFAPINYLTWGEAWHDKFRYSSHPDSELYATGTPWHEYLTELQVTNEPEYDVLFLSSSGRQTTEGEQAYEDYVDKLIGICERREWELGIKLHPKETGDWYRDRGWGSYVIEETDIQNALSKTRVAITTASSTLIEALMMGTPICKWLDQLSPVERNADLPLVFDITPDTIEETLESALTLDDVKPVAVEKLNAKGATDRIIRTVTNT